MGRPARGGRRAGARCGGEAGRCEAGGPEAPDCEHERGARQRSCRLFGNRHVSGIQCRQAGASGRSARAKARPHGERPHGSASRHGRPTQAGCRAEALRQSGCGCRRTTCAGRCIQAFSSAQASDYSCDYACGGSPDCATGCNATPAGGCTSPASRCHDACANRTRVGGRRLCAPRAVAHAIAAAPSHANRADSAGCPSRPGCCSDHRAGACNPSGRGHDLRAGCRASRCRWTGCRAAVFVPRPHGRSRAAGGCRAHDAAGGTHGHGLSPRPGPGRTGP